MCFSWLETSKFLQTPHKTLANTQKLFKIKKKIIIYGSIAITHLLPYLLKSLFPYAHMVIVYMQSNRNKLNVHYETLTLAYNKTHMHSQPTVFIVAMRSCQGQEPQSES